MDLVEIALRRQKEKLKELLKEQDQQDALQVLKQGHKSVLPYLRKAYLRLQLTNYLKIPKLLKNYSPKELAKYFAEIYKLPASPEEAKIQLLADMVISLLFPHKEKEIELIVNKAFSEVETAYKPIIQYGGGWSSSENDTEKRKSAVLEQFRINSANFTYLKEKHLQDQSLYNPGGRQEKRNFIGRLIKTIVEDEIGKKITFPKINTFIKDIKKISLRLEDL